MDIDIDHLRGWVGRSMTAKDTVDGRRTAALAATLDLDSAPGNGDYLPPLWHWLGFLPCDRASDLGDDGHPHRGGFLPPVPLPRRMWAGSQFEFHRPLQVGTAAERISTVRSVDLKAGRSGALVFVRIEHALQDASGPLLTEWHDIVYREPAAPGSSPPPAKPAPDNAVWTWNIEPDPVLLFRYSALTFNGHRIHYDRRYAMDVEGYPGLIVHGPLQATLLLELLRREQPDATVTAFSFRALRPVFDTGPITVCGQPGDEGAVQLWITDADGAMAMEATATIV
ncbi:MAG: acyl-CoA dehydrogenase [Gammaproteobacteria bacterium]|nr:MAG: acyl-CoA dehydrogenase [Gammaproteobacteria bacterium]